MQLENGKCYRHENCHVGKILDGDEEYKKIVNAPLPLNTAKISTTIDPTKIWLEIREPAAAK